MANTDDTTTSAPPSTDVNSPSKNTQSSNTKSKTNQNSNQESKKKNPDKRNKRRQKKRKLLPVDQLQEDVCKALKNCPEGTELKTLMYTLQPEVDFMECIFKRIFIDITTVVQQRYKNFEIHPFGSSVCGLAFKTSDFDIYIDIKNGPGKTKKCISKVIYQMMETMKRLNLFEQTIAIVNAKIPLLKCVHITTGFSCDFSFTSPMGRYNSQIIRNIIYIDCRIHPLILILKHWMKSRNLLGTGKITSYCLIMMVIYYLQTVKILKPLVLFQAQMPKFIVDKYWNLAWNTSCPWNQNNCPNLTVSKLLRGFVDFYKDFDFSKYIICPLYGQTYEREVFAKQIPPEFDAYIEYMKTDGNLPLNLHYPMCVQDPFALNHNVATSSRSVFRYFKIELSHSSEIFAKQLKPGVKSADFLYKFFTEFANESNLNSLPSNPSKSCEYQIRLLPIEFELSVIRRIMMENSKTNETIEPFQVKKHWSILTVDLIRFIFEKLFMLKVTPMAVNDTTTERLKKYQKLNGQKDVSDTSDIINWNLTGTEDVYFMKKLTKVSSPTYFTDEVNYAINRYKTLHESKKHSIDLNCNLSITITPVDVFVVFNEHNLSKKNTVKCLYQNFTRSIRNHMKAYFLFCERSLIFASPELLQSDSVKEEVDSSTSNADKPN